MARGVNKVILIGNLGNDPEVRYTPNGSAVANVSLATSEAWRDKQSGELQEKTEWHRVVFFSRLAEIVGQYLHKGSKVYVEGSLRTRKWTDKSNVERYTTEIVANEMHMLDSKNSGGGAGAERMHPSATIPAGEPIANFAATTTPHAAAAASSPASPMPMPAEQNAGTVSSAEPSIHHEDDIPF